MARLKYHGVIRTSFDTGDVGPVEPEGEFEVPDDLAEQFIRRDDIEDITSGKSAKSKPNVDVAEEPKAN